MLQVSAYLDQGLKAFVFGVEFFVEVDRFVVAAAELSINLLHAIGIAARKLENATSSSSSVSMFCYKTLSQTFFTL